MIKMEDCEVSKYIMLRLNKCKLRMSTCESGLKTFMKGTL